MIAHDLHALNIWEELLRNVNPLREAENLAAAVLDPAIATADECWWLVWNKPLFANTRVEIGENATKSLEPFMVSAWQDWGLPTGPIAISHTGGLNQRANFVVTGSKADEIETLGIARHRLLAIQGGANLLRALVKEDADNPFKPIAALSRRDAVHRIQSLAGRGWGHITALHLLTDFGLAVKPDLHLVRTIKATGLLPHLAPREVPSLNDALTINEAVDELGTRIYGPDYGPTKRRYLDKVLMELSRKGLLAHITNKEVA